MFDFTLSEEEQMIRKTAADFGAERLYPPFRENEKTKGVPKTLQNAYAELGFAELEVPEALGGAGLSPLCKALVLEGLAAGDAAAAIALDGLGPALYPLLEMGGDEGATLVTELLGNGGRGFVVIDNEEERFSVDGGKISGTWPWVPASSLAVLVVLKNGGAYVMREGIELTPVKPGALDAAGSSELRVNGTVAHVFHDAKGYARTIARLRLYAAALLAGVAGASLRHAVAYAQERVVFGKPVAHHQGVAFLVADLAARLDGARLSLWRAVWALSQQGDPTEAAAGALLNAVEIGLEIGEQGVQLLGGHGYMQDHPVEKWMRETRVLAQLWGGRDGALDAAAASLFDASGDVGFDLPVWQGAS